MHVPARLIADRSAQPCGVLGIGKQEHLHMPRSMRDAHEPGRQWPPLARGKVRLGKYENHFPFDLTSKRRKLRRRVGCRTIRRFQTRANDDQPMALAKHIDCAACPTGESVRGRAQDTDWPLARDVENESAPARKQIPNDRRQVPRLAGAHAPGNKHDPRGRRYDFA